MNDAFLKVKVSSFEAIPSLLSYDFFLQNYTRNKIFEKSSYYNTFQKK